LRGLQNLYAPVRSRPAPPILSQVKSNISECQACFPYEITGVSFSLISCLFCKNVRHRRVGVGRRRSGRPPSRIVINKTHDPGHSTDECISGRRESTSCPAAQPNWADRFLVSAIPAAKVWLNHNGRSPRRPTRCGSRPEHGQDNSTSTPCRSSSCTAAHRDRWWTFARTRIPGLRCWRRSCGDSGYRCHQFYAQEPLTVVPKGFNASATMVVSMSQAVGVQCHFRGTPNVRGSDPNHKVPMEPKNRLKCLADIFNLSRSER
jgi:hypothetical protein